MKRKTSPVTMGCAVFIGFGFLMVLMGGILGGFEGGSSTPARPAVASKELVAARLCRMANDAVRARLKAPSTADFPSCGWSMDQYTITASPDMKEAAVIGYVDAQNGFGAKLRSRYVVNFKTAGAPGAGEFQVTKVVLE